MEVITFDSAAFKSLEAKLDHVNQRLDEKEKEPSEKWLDNQDVIQMLHISKRTLQFYRDSGKLPFSQIQSKIYYRLSDIEEFLMSNYHKAFAKNNLHKVQSGL